MLECALPYRPASVPVTSADWPTFTSAERAVSRSEISSRAPRPVGSRSSKAPRIAVAAA